ncbi:MAG: hypothetical protein M1812_003830 [Candelaria pacifica]|nr:MAG: hypothetical protein M1812_003830 [Candelaria pacifica]
MSNPTATIPTTPTFTETQPISWQNNTTETTIRARADAVQHDIRHRITTRRSATTGPNLQHMQIWIDSPAYNDASPEAIASLRRKGLKVAIFQMRGVDMERFDDDEVVIVDSDPEDERVMVDSDVDEHESDESAVTVVRRRRNIHEGPKKPEPGWVAGLIAHPISVAARERMREELVRSRESVTERLVRTRRWGEEMGRDVYGQWRAFRNEGGLTMLGAYLNYDGRIRY